MTRLVDSAHLRLQAPGRRQKRPAVLQQLLSTGVRLPRFHVKHRVCQQPLSSFGGGATPGIHDIAHLWPTQPLARDRIPEPLAGPLARPREGKQWPRRHGCVDLSPSHPLLHCIGQLLHSFLPRPHPPRRPARPMSDFLRAPAFRLRQVRHQPSLFHRAQPSSPPQALPQRQPLRRPRLPHRRLYRVVLESVPRPDRREALHHRPPIPFEHHHHRPRALHADRRHRLLLSALLTRAQTPVPQVQLSQLQFHRVPRSCRDKIRSPFFLHQTRP